MARKEAEGQSGRDAREEERIDVFLDDVEAVATDAEEDAWRVARMVVFCCCFSGGEQERGRLFATRKSRRAEAGRERKETKQWKVQGQLKSRRRHRKSLSSKSKKKKNE